MVPDFERVAAQFQLQRLPDLNALDDRDVLVEEHRSIEFIPRQVSDLARPHIAKTVRDNWRARETIRPCSSSVRADEARIDENHRDIPTGERNVQSITQLRSAQVGDGCLVCGAAVSVYRAPPAGKERERCAALQSKYRGNSPSTDNAIQNPVAGRKSSRPERQVIDEIRLDRMRHVKARSPSLGSRLGIIQQRREIAL